MAFTVAIRSEGAEELSRSVEGSLLVGRAKDCDLCIADQRLSRHHARLFVEGGALFVEDLGGPNGTTVNDAPVKGRRALAPGDVVGLGKTLIAVLEPGGPTKKRLARRADRGVRPALIKPVGDLLARPAELSPADYLASLGLGEDTLLDARASTLESVLRRTRDFAVLNEVSRAVQRERDGRAMLDHVLELILEVTRGDRGFAALLDEAGELTLEASHAKRGAGEGALALSQTIAEHVLDQGLALICADATADERLRNAASIMLSDARSLMAVPIVVQQRVLGLIQLESSHLGRPFDERDLDLVSMVASMVGVALDNLRLLERRARTIAELEAAQAQLVATQERLVHSEQLAAIGRLAAGIAHEVRNHLSPFELASLIAAKHPDDAGLQEAAEMMREAAQHILDLVNQVRAFASGAESTAERTPHDVAAVAESVLRFLRYDAVLRRVSLTLEAAGPRHALLDPRSFRQVLVNLIRNAAQALPPKDGRIVVRVFDSVGRVVVEVDDNGCGIAPEVAERVFEPFFTTKGEHGLGLGLDISRKIVVDHGGALTFDSTPGVGTVFRVTLPEWTDDATDPNT